MEHVSAPINFDTALAACGGDLELVRALIGKFRARLPDEWKALTEMHATEPPNWEQIRERVHRLQSASANLGISRVAGAAKALEASFLSQNPSNEGRIAAWQALEEAFQEFLAC